MPRKEILNTIEKLSQASRFMGNSGILKTRKLIKKAFQLNDCEFEEQAFNTPMWNQYTSPEITLISSQETFTALPAILSSPTPKEGVEGTLSIESSILILGCFKWERLSVMQKGVPIAYIISSKIGTKIQPIPKSEQGKTYIIVDYNLFSYFLKKMESNNLPIHVRLKNSCVLLDENIMSYNIIQKKTSFPYILICAHYDTVIDSPGALDNASGVAIAIELLNKATKGKWPCRICFFDGEEINHIGSDFFVHSLSEEDINEIKLVIEVDTVGAGNDITFLCSKKISKLLRNIKSELEIPQHYTININPQSKITFCDVWPFMQKKVPVIRMLTKNPVNQKQSRDYIHSINDTFDKVEPNTVEASFNVLNNMLPLIMKHILID